MPLAKSYSRNHKSERVSLVPRAGYLLSSMRDIGYSFETAVADLVDNSISASAESIWIDAEWNKGDKFVAISDNGNGLSRDALIEAMRLASSDPTIDREDNDLGRYGLGLKTASLSQCRRFTVASKTTAGTYAVTWDIDQARAAGDDGGWMVEVLDCTETGRETLLGRLIQERLAGMKSGSLVVWEKIDRPDPETTRKVGGEGAFTDQLSSLIEHLALTFHRFLNSASSKEKVELYVNNKKVEGFDPYNSDQIATKQPAPETIIIRNIKVQVTPYVLPHPSKVSAEEYRKYEGKDGYLENSGFYIYRNKRLISKGTWHRLIRRSNLSKLLRIQVDIPTSLDFLWRIDVRKSQAEVPADIKKELQNFIKRWEMDAKVVYRHRGSVLIERTIDPLWNRAVNDGRICYKVNRENPFFRNLERGLDAEKKKALRLYFDMVDAAFPHNSVMCDLDGDKQTVVSAKISDSDIMEMLRQYVSMSQKAWTETELLRVGVFNAYPEIVHKFVEGGCK